MNKTYVLFPLLLALTVSTASAVDFGRYSLREGGTIPSEVALQDTANENLYRSLAERPAYYQIEVPPGEYQVVIHYLNGEKNNGSFTVEVNGQEKVTRTPCIYEVKGNKEMPKSLSARQVSFSAEAGQDGLRIRFPRPFRESYGPSQDMLMEQQYAICGLEVFGSQASIRINCGSGEDMTDADGNTWVADRELPIEEVTNVKIQLAPNDQNNEWVDIGTEMIEKLQEAGADPIVKWGGRFVRQANVLIADRSGNTYVNFGGIGLWKYGGPGEILERADDQGYASVAKGEALNPYGPGFVLFCSHGFGENSEYQALSWNGVDIQTWPLDGDFGTVDWTREGTPLIFCHPRHSEDLAISIDGGETLEVVTQQKGVTNLGALGDGVLIYTVGARSGEGAAIGIYRSEDLGATWAKVADGINCFSTANCSTILAYENRAYLQADDGLYKSEDRGKTWRKIENSPVFQGAPLPGKDDSHLLAFSKEGGFESHDYGETWQKIMPAPPESSKWLQSHRYYNFAWDVEDDIIYAYAPDSIYRYQRSDE